MNQGWTFGDGKGGIDRYFHLFLDTLIAMASESYC
jgi:hypothetical protein